MDDSARPQLFEEARRSAGWTLEQLWIHYLALGGSLVFFDLDAYLTGLTPMTPGQQDVLACTLNERLADLHHTTRIPYLTALSDTDKYALTHLLRQLPGQDSSD